MREDDGQISLRIDEDPGRGCSRKITISGLGVMQAPKEGLPLQTRRCVKQFVQECEACEAWKRSPLSKDLKTRPPFPFPSLVKESTFTGIRFLVTEDKFVGLGSTMMLPGDMIYVLAGGSHPCCASVSGAALVLLLTR